MDKTKVIIQRNFPGMIHFMKKTVINFLEVPDCHRIIVHMVIHKSLTVFDCKVKIRRIIIFYYFLCMRQIFSRFFKFIVFQPDRC